MDLMWNLDPFFLVFFLGCYIWGNFFHERVFCCRYIILYTLFVLHPITVMAFKKREVCVLKIQLVGNLNHL